MQIESERLLLRAVEDVDNELLRYMLNSREIELKTCGWSLPISKRQQQAWYEAWKQKDNEIRYVIEEKTSGTALGVVMLKDIDFKNGTGEIHIKLAEQTQRKKGYGTEAVQLLVEYAFKELRLHSVQAIVNVKNEASNKMFLKCGFQKEGELKERIYKEGEYININVYSKIYGESV